MCFRECENPKRSLVQHQIVSPAKLLGEPDCVLSIHIPQAGPFLAFVRHTMIRLQKVQGTGGGKSTGSYSVCIYYRRINESLNIKQQSQRPAQPPVVMNKRAHPCANDNCYKIKCNRNVTNMLQTGYGVVREQSRRWKIGC